MQTSYLVNLGTIDAIPLGQGLCYIVKGEEIAVFRSRSGEIAAIENKCPHARGPLSEGILGNGKVVCPLHGHKFDLASGKGTEKKECVRVFKVWEQHGQIILEFPLDLLGQGKNNGDLFERSEYVENKTCGS